MGNIEKAFFVLGIERTKNKRDIKKAYANKVKEYHPEEHPELWERVRNAYKIALDYADGKTSYEQEPMPQYEEGSRVVSEKQQVFSSEDREADYRNVFIDAQRQDADQYQSMVRQTLDALLRLSRIQGIQYQADWIQLLGSEHFNQTWDDDLVLQALMTTLSQVRFTPDTARLVLKRLDAMRQRFVSSMQSYKAKMTEDMIRIVGTRSPIHSGNGMQPTQKKRSFAWVWILIVVVVGIAGIGVLGRSLKSGAAQVSEREAATLIMEHLEKKYPDISIDEESGYISKISEYSTEKNDSVKIGYKMEFRAPKDGMAKLFFWKTEDGEIKTSCFDNLQTKEIEADMKVKMQEITGMEEIEISLSGCGDDGVRGFREESGAIYKETYEGDMQAFFAEEAENKAEVFDSTEILKKETLQKERVNPNGKCMIYLKDSKVASIDDRLKNKSTLHESGMEKGLFEFAESHQLKVWAIGLPIDEYDKLIKSKKSSSYLAKQSFAFGEDESNHIPNVLPSVATVWYQSKDQVQESGVHVPEVVEAGTQMYRVSDWEKAGTEATEMDNVMEEIFGDKEAVLEDLEKERSRSDFKMEQAEIPSETKTFLKNEGRTSSDTVSIRVTFKGQPSDGYLIVKKDSIKVGDEEFECVYQDNKAETEDMQCEFRTVNYKMEEITNIYSKGVYDTEGYLMIAYNGGYQQNGDATFTICK